MSDDKVVKKLENDLEIANQANEVINNPQYQNAILQYKAALFEAFIASSDAEADKRESIYRQSKCIRVVEGNLNTLVNTGKLALESLKLNGEEI